MISILFSILIAAQAQLPSTAPATQPAGQQVQTAEIKAGDLLVQFRDNSKSPKLLSGIVSLFNIKDSKHFNAFDPKPYWASAGLNFEHIISGHKNSNNKFTPRQGKFNMYLQPDGKSVILIRDAKDSPWKVSSTLKYTVTEPHYIDVEFRCKFHDKSLFGKRGYAITFWANYMNNVAEVPLNFLGIEKPGGKEKWIVGDAPDKHPDWNEGGTYRSLKAKDLKYDDDVEFRLNTWSYDYPRFTKPFYYGRTAKGMAYIIMFDRTLSPQDEIRFSIFKFKKNPPRPAWDYQYVIHKVEENKEYGYQARVVWKKFISPKDCLSEYEKWQKKRNERDRSN